MKLYEVTAILDGTRVIMRVPALLTLEITEWVYVSVNDDDPLTDAVIAEAAAIYAHDREAELKEVVDWDGGKPNGESE